MNSTQAIVIVMNGINQIIIKKTNDFNPDNIQLIYKGEILEQFDIETDKYSEDDFKEDNNINVIIIKNDENDDDDNDSNISFISD